MVMQNVDKFNPYKLSVTLLLTTLFFPLNFELLIGFNFNLIIYLIVIIAILSKPLPKIKLLYKVWFVLIAFYLLREVKMNAVYGEAMNLLPALRITIYLFTFTLATKWEDLIWSLRLVIALIIASMLWGFSIYFFGEPFASVIKTYGYVNENWSDRIGKGARMFGFVGDIVLFSYQLALLPIYFWFRYRQGRKATSILVLLLSSFAVILSGERALVLAIIAGVVMYEGVGVRKIFVTAFSVMSLGLIMYGANSIITSTSEFEDGAINRLTEQDEHLEDRYLKQYAALKTIIENPVNGGSFEQYAKTYYRLTGLEANAAHNYYLNIARDIGITAWLLLAYLVYNLFKAYRAMNKTLRHTDKFQFVRLLFILMISVSIIGLAHNSGLFYAESAILSLTGLLIGSVNVSHKNHHLLSKL